MDYSIDELREMLAEWAGWGETMADGRIGPDAAARFLADFERLVRMDALARGAEEVLQVTDGYGASAAKVLDKMREAVEANK